MSINEPKWYIVQVVSNHEQKVKESLENRIFEEDSFAIEDVFLPLEKTLTKTGKTKFKIIFPGYIFVKVIMSDASWYVIRNTQYVTGIVGSSGQRTKPTPIPEKQIQTILKRIEASNDIDENIEIDSHKIFKTTYKVGDWVIVNNENFNEKEGKVTSIDLENQTVIVEIDFFGRTTPITLFIKDVVNKVNSRKLGN